MGVKTKVLKDGKWVGGEELEFETIKEDWNIYKAEDGTIVKIKVVVAKIIKTEDRNKLTDEPGFTVTSQNIVTTIQAKALKEK